VTESYSIRQLCKLSGYSACKLNDIKDYWLARTPSEVMDHSQVHYLICDATYFHKEGCMLNLMNASDQRIIAHVYIKKESFQAAYPWFLSLKEQGLSPRFITTDGEQSMLRAMKKVWPEARFQRCLYHIQHEGMRWLRSYPKTEAGKALRCLLGSLCSINTLAEKDYFIEMYAQWLRHYQGVVLSLPRSTVAYKDLQRTIVLLNNALPHMFYYLENFKVPATTNALEGFHSRLKTDYQRHRGLNKAHKIGYIHWYCYFKNKAK
jgi:hypothetical protein